MKDKLGIRINELIDRTEWRELEGLLLNTEDEWVIETLIKRLQRPEGPKWVGGYLSALSCDTRESTKLRLKIYENVLEEVRNEVGRNEKTTAELVGILSVHIDSFPTQIVVNLIDHYVEYIKSGAPLQGKWVDLLAKLITTLSQKEDVTISGKQMAGEDYRYQVLRTLCDLSWSAETTTSLLPVFDDMDLPKEELQDVIFKVEKVLKEADYQSVPPIIYHLILLVQGKLPVVALQVIIEYFNKQELNFAQEKSRETKETNSMDLDSEIIDNDKYSDLTEAKGTVILHVTHHAQYNPALVRDYLKFIKSSTWLSERLITPFNLALSLSLTSIEKFQDQILESIKSCLLKGFRLEEQCRQSQWLRETWGKDCDITAAFRTIVDNCIMGWDQVSQGLVQLSFKLLESGGGPKGESYVSQQAVELASMVLPLIIKKQTHLARPVISQLSNFILSSSSPVHYIKILRNLTKSVPLLLLDHLNVIRELLEYLELLSLSDACHFLHALLPLLKMSMSLKDALMIILRKMLFSKRVESRQIAVRGFLQFLRHFRVVGTLPSSQSSTSFSSSLSTFSISVDVHSVFNSSVNEALSLELLGVLRRCFSQQHEVKSTLYLGLCDVCRANPKLAVSILEMLLKQSKCFLDLGADTLNPVILKKVINVQGDTVNLVEPIGELLSTLASCKTYYEEHRENENGEDDDNEEDAVAVLNEICSLFDVLTEKLAFCDLEDLGIDSRGDFSTGSSSGQKNVLSTKVMIGVFDSLIQHTFTNRARNSEERMQTVLSLFKSQRKIVTLVKEKNGKPGKKEGSKGKGRPQTKASISFKSHISLQVTADMLAVSLCDDSSDTSKSSNVLKNNHELQLYLLSVVEESLASLKRLTESEKERKLPSLRIIAKVLLQECNNNLGSVDSSDQREVMRLSQCVHIFDSLMSIFNKFYNNKLEAILKEMMGRNDNKSLNALLHKIVKCCQKMLLKIINNDERTPLLKDATVLVHVMMTVTQAMDSNCPEIESIQQWVLQLCKDQDFAHNGLAHSMMNLLFRLSDQVKANHNLTRGIAQELHHELGDFEEGVEVEKIGKYKMITESTSPTILLTILSHLDDLLNLIEFALNKMKACVVSDTDYNADKIEKYISMKYSIVMIAVREIIQSALPLGGGSLQSVRLVTKLYKVLTLYVKYYLDLYRLKNFTQISDKFEKVVRMSGESVTVFVYPLISYIEGAQRQEREKNQASLTNRTKKESKLIPSLIFAIEQYEKHLIALSRKSKVNLMEAMKMSTARDFRIISATLMEALQKGQEEDEEDVSNEEDAAEDEDGNEATEESVNDNKSQKNASRLAKNNEKNMQKRKPFSRENKRVLSKSDSQNKSTETPAKKRKRLKSRN